MLRLLDTLAVLLAPITAAWDQEFGGPPAAQSEPPADDRPADGPMLVYGLPAACAPDVTETPAETPAAGEKPCEPSPAARDRDVTAPAETLYVRRGTGRGARYDLAGPGDPGTRYRREVVGGRRRFTPVEAGR